MADMDFSDRAVLVTGAARGLGKQIARALHARGARVALNDLSEPCRRRSRRRSAVGRRRSRHLDGGGMRGRRPRALSTSAGSTCSSTNAAINWEMPIAAHTEEIWDKHVDTNPQRAASSAPRRRFPALKAKCEAISSISPRSSGLHPIVNNVAYCAAIGRGRGQPDAGTCPSSWRRRSECNGIRARAPWIRSSCAIGAQASGRRSRLLPVHIRTSKPLKRIAKSREEVAEESSVFVASAACRLHDRRHHSGRYGGSIAGRPMIGASRAPSPAGGAPIRETDAREPPMKRFLFLPLSACAGGERRSCWRPTQEPRPRT
jgi:hypothetical protein